MGEPWIWEHPQSGMTEFSIVKRSAQETFSRSWAEKVTEWSNFSQDPQGAVAVPQTSLAAGLAQQQILPVAAQLQTTAAEAQKQAADAKKAAADAKKKAAADAQKKAAADAKAAEEMLQQSRGSDALVQMFPRRDHAAQGRAGRPRQR